MKSKRVTKDPEIRKQELIEVAKRLFIQHGYENISVRDILNEVGGAPGMFYYYFESKKDIFEVAMTQLTNEVLAKREEIFFSSDLSIMKKLESLIRVTVNDQRTYLNALNVIKNTEPFFWGLSIKITDAMSTLVSEALLNSLNSGQITITEKINFDNVSEISRFITYGIMGVLQDMPENEKEQNEKIDRILLYIDSFFEN